MCQRTRLLMLLEKLRLARVLEARREAGSLRRVAAEAGIADGYLSRLERGLGSIPGDEVADRLGRVLGVVLRAEARQSRSRIAAAIEDRRTARRPRAGQATVTTDGVVGLVGLLSRDDRLLADVLALVQAPEQIRSAVTRLLRDLTVRQ